MVNALTRKTGLTLGPIILETLVKHYFERVSDVHEAEDSTKLRKEELLYDEAFNIIKSFMEAATKHTVEELQAFSNTRTPSPPWVHSVRLLVPMSCCDDAATHLINVLGGEQLTKRVVGGTKWWQVRGIKGVDAEWMVAKKDWQEAKKKQKAQESSMDGTPVDNGNPEQESPAEYQAEMDQLRCILYAHGGGYYFGSFDQERYSIQRMARKINGRVFAINYRLAPQYPFPCAIQDLLAAYLYLIRPPTGSQHAPVSPSHIVLGGDSAGGGLCVATLQVIRDAGLPLPAGAVLISPWCDLTHSFPSIHLNTSTDIIPQFGLSFHKPSTLWPPPPDELTTQVHHSLRRRIREAIRHTGSKDGKLDVPHADPPSRPATPDYNVDVPESSHALHLGGAGSVPIQMDGVRSQRVSMTTPSGEAIAIDSQVHMYAPNYLLTHPLVSSVVSYLGGLPPLLVIASDKEVLRDEIVYLAHKAAHPDRFPVKPESRALYPPLEGIERRHKPTKVHLQVYDDCAHTLPVLFAFTTPGKFCFRAMATFTKYVTGMLPRPSAEIPVVIPDAPLTASPMSTQTDILKPGHAVEMSGDTSSTSSRAVAASAAPPAAVGHAQESSSSSNVDGSAGPSATHDKDTTAAAAAAALPKLGKRMSVRRALSVRVTHAKGLLLRQHSVSGARSPPPSPAAHELRGFARDASDVGGPRFNQRKESGDVPEHLHTGEPSVYDQGLDTMIRERISTRGVIRALEPESALAAFRLPPALVGEISELAVRRYIDGTERFRRKFGKAAKAVEKARRRNLERASADTARSVAQLQAVFSGGARGGALEWERGAGRGGGGDGHEHEPVHEHGEGRAARALRTAGTGAGVRAGLGASGSWPWAWALDGDEHPPPSSIVSRRDTEEARRLARVADQAVMMEESAVSANNLWSLIVNFLTVTPERDKRGRAGAEEAEDDPSGEVPREKDVDEAAARRAANPRGKSRRERIVSSFARLVVENKKFRGASAASKAHGEQ